MKKFIHVVRGSDKGIDFGLLNADGSAPRLRNYPTALVPKTTTLNPERSNFTKEAEFILVDERDAETVMTNLAANNPGCEVRVYTLEQVAECPAGPMVLKKVDESGVLPG